MLTLAEWSEGRATPTTGRDDGLLGDDWLLQARVSTERWVGGQSHTDYLWEGEGDYDEEEEFEEEDQGGQEFIFSSNGGSSRSDSIL